MSTKIVDYDSWRGKWPLRLFWEKLGALDFKDLESTRRVLMKTKFRVSYNTILTIYTWIGCILERLDSEMSIWLEPELKNRLRVNPHLINLDIISLILFCSILMESIPRFLGSLLSSRRRPKTGSFANFKKTIKDYEGVGLEELKKVIENTTWFEELKELRDKPIAHRGHHYAQIGTIGERVGIWLLYIKNGKLKEKFYSNLEINELCQKIHHFLEDLNKFLCDNFDLLPIRITKTADLR